PRGRRPRLRRAGGRLGRARAARPGRRLERERDDAALAGRELHLGARAQPARGERLQAPPAGRQLEAEAAVAAVGGAPLAGEVARAVRDRDVGAPRRRPVAQHHPGERHPATAHAAASRKPAASRSASAITGRWVLAEGTRGITEASITHSPSRPYTRPAGSTTASGSS